MPNQNEKGHWYTDKNGNHYFVEEGQSPKEGWEASKRRKMISDGKYQVDDGDGKGPRDVDKDEYDKYEADQADFDATTDDDFGFDEENAVDEKQMYHEFMDYFRKHRYTDDGTPIPVDVDALKERFPDLDGNLIDRAVSLEDSTGHYPSYSDASASREFARQRREWLKNKPSMQRPSFDDEEEDEDDRPIRQRKKKNKPEQDESAGGEKQTYNEFRDYLMGQRDDAGTMPPMDPDALKKQFPDLDEDLIDAAVKTYGSTMRMPSYEDASSRRISMNHRRMKDLMDEEVDKSPDREWTEDELYDVIKGNQSKYSIPLSDDDFRHHAKEYLNRHEWKKKNGLLKVPDVGEVEGEWVKGDGSDERHLRIKSGPFAGDYDNWDDFWSTVRAGRKEQVAPRKQEKEEEKIQEEPKTKVTSKRKKTPSIHSPKMQKIINSTAKEIYEYYDGDYIDYGDVYDILRGEYGFGERMANAIEKRIRELEED